MAVDPAAPVALLPADHRAVVIGACGELGRAICRAYALAGACVHGLDMDAERAAEAAGSLPGAGHASGPINVVDLDSVGRSVQAVFPGEPISSVVYAAGVAITAEVVATNWSEYDRLMGVNLRGAFHVAQAYASRLLAHHGPSSIVFLVSTAGKRGEPGGAAYCASKFALIGLIESFAAEVGPSGMRVNGVCPGNVDSPMLRSVAAAQAKREGRDPVAVLREYAASAAERRLVAPEEVANVCVWLASPYASGVNGESINVDAGLLTG
jgi:NAD(P)-dependent dehydrogenase (short-subunit alcohol dehydrogenase family)